jgi:uncharacterized metal-binding protein YceD (DUF177 family)
MKIVFDKVGNQQKSFRLKIQNINFEGTLEKIGYHLVRLNSNIEGKIDLICDRCAKEYQKDIKFPLQLTLSKEVIETEDDLDIIEFLDGIIDLDFILQSEIISIQNSYHFCDNCQNDTTEFEKEF